MKNYQIKGEDGNYYWIHRSMAISCILYSYDKGELKFLISKRGKGCSDYPGKWNFVCGYLDFDETIEQCLYREVKEELGIDISFYHDIVLHDIKDSPSEHLQNVTFRFSVRIPYNIPVNITNEVEPDEVEEYAWISKKEICEYDFAFDHSEILLNFIP